MKKLFTPAAIVTALLISSCSGMMEMKRIDMTQVEQIQDSLATIAGTSSLHVLQDDDYSKVTIIIGNVGLYNAGKEKVQETANRVGMMVLHVLGPECSISNGVFAVSLKDPDKEAIPDGAITADMNIKSAKKVVFPGK